jgi:hypothetical protein
MDDPLRQIVVYSDARPVLAQLLRDRLIEAGIKAFIENEDAWQAMGDLPGSLMGPPRVVVAAANEAQAREIVAEFESEERLRK